MDVKTLCLGVLSLGDASGYEIKKVFEHAFSHFFVAGYGSIYPALADLDRNGLVSCTTVEQESRPAKKVYRLTDAGRLVLLQSLHDAVPNHRVRSEFLVLTFFAQLLSPQRLAAIIDERIEAAATELTTLKDIANCEGLTPGPAFTVGLSVAVMEAALTYMRENRESLLAAADGGQEPKEKLQ